MSGGVLALDVATRVGWAYGLPSERPVSGVWQLPASASYGERYNALSNELVDAFRLHKPALVIVEAPLVRQDHSARFLLGAVAIVQLIACKWSVRFLEQDAATARKQVLGRGTFPKGTAKAAVMQWARCAGYWPATDDEADALCLWTCATTNLHRRASTAGIGRVA